MKSNSFSKWKEGAWAPGCADEIGLVVVDLRELPGVEDALPDEKSTSYFYSVMGASEKRATPLFAEVKRWLFISDSESQRLQAMEFVNTTGPSSHCKWTLLITTRQSLSDLEIY